MKERLCIQIFNASRRLVTGLMVLCHFTYAQDIKFEQFNVNDGLSQNTVACIHQDKTGFMWFGTRDGLNRYDGYKFTVFRRNLRNRNCISANDIKAIVEDDSANLWIATHSGGLNCFNLKTETFTHYRNNPLDGRTIASDYLRSLCIDSRGRLWIGTDNGLDAMDLKTKKIIHYKNNRNDERSISDNAITAIKEDLQHKIWIGTLRGGLNLFDDQSGSFKHFVHAETDGSIPCNNIQFIHEQQNGMFWIGMYGGGLAIFDRDTKRFEPVHYGHGNDALPEFLLSATEDSQGNLWIGTENHGLKLLNSVTQTVKTFYHYDNDQTSVASNSVMSLYRDKKGNIWIGTFQGGVNLINSDIDKFRHYKYRHDANSISSNAVTTLYEDSKDNIWIGTDGGGLNLFHPGKGTFEHFYEKVSNGLCSNFVLAVCEDNAGDIWVGTWGKGVSVYNPGRKTFRQYNQRQSAQTGLSNDYAFCIYKDKRGRIWVGTYGGGLNLFDPSVNRFTYFRHDDKDSASISADHILTIYEDHAQRLWIGTDGGGLNLFDEAKGQFYRFNNVQGTRGISNNIINTICEDSQGMLWLGTNFGLNRINPETRQVTDVYFTEQGLPNDVVTGILCDSLDNLWIGTTRGLSKLDSKRKVFKNFTLSDGIQANDFRAQCLSRRGMMYFGGKNGFNEFAPGKIGDLAFEPPIVFTSFQVFNKEVPIIAADTNVIRLPQAISQLHEIDISYRESVISFEFASLNFTGTEKKQYKYFLEGFDKEWNNIGSKNSVTYTNLDPGTYKLHVRGLKNDGKWSETEAVMTIHISPPFWKTWWFNLLIAIVALAVVMLIFYIRLSAIRQRNRQLAQEVRHRTRELSEANTYLRESNDEVKRQNEKLEVFNQEIVRQSDKILLQQEKIVLQNHELEDTIRALEKTNATKDRFFSILAHDLKNPVAALTGISDGLKNELPNLDREALTYYVSNINKSSHAIHGLLSNLLDWGRSHAQNIPCNPESVSLYELAMKNFALVEQQLDSKKIQVQLNVEPHDAIYVDYYMADAVIRNIVSNCIKFTPAYGQILIESKRSAGKIELIIQDTGIGMTEEQINTLFKLDSKQTSRGTNGEPGTGLGLIITKEFLDVNGGTIDVFSNPGKGTTFVIGFPASLPGENMKLNGDSPMKYESVKPYSLNKLPEEHISKLKGKRILIVDDNREIRAFLKLILSGVCEIFEAENGLQGLSIAEQMQPAIIVTDMLMPVMNGLEFCEKIKSNSATSHIPVVVLTSQTEDDHQASGYAAGADVYLTKPLKHNIFFQVLLSIVKNQERIRERFSAEPDVYPKDLVLNKLDEEFMNKIIHHVEEHLADPNLDYKQLCELTAMSRSLLYSKFKTITGFGVHDFIKSIRLKKGLQLLMEGKLNITQVAFEVGFTTPSHFSKSFARQYHQSPSEYVNSLRKKQSAT